PIIPKIPGGPRRTGMLAERPGANAGHLLRKLIQNAKDFTGVGPWCDLVEKDVTDHVALWLARYDIRGKPHGTRPYGRRPDLISCKIFRYLIMSSEYSRRLLRSPASFRPRPVYNGAYIDCLSSCEHGPPY